MTRHFSFIAQTTLAACILVILCAGNGIETVSTQRNLHVPNLESGHPGNLSTPFPFGPKLAEFHVAELKDHLDPSNKVYWFAWQAFILKQNSGRELFVESCFIPSSKTKTGGMGGNACATPLSPCF